MKRVIYLMILIVMGAYVSSCEKTHDGGSVLTKTSYSLKSDSSTGIDGNVPSSAVWDSQNEYVATAIGRNLSSHFIGSTYLQWNGNTIKVDVKPRYNLYDEPDMSWGTSLNTIISRYGAPDKESGNMILYETGNKAVPYELYQFSNNSLTACGVVAHLEYGSSLVDFLGERYLFYSVDTYNYTADFAHCYGKKNNPQIDYVGQMAFSSSIGGIVVVYVGGNTSRSENSATIVESFANNLESLI